MAKYPGVRKVQLKKGVSYEGRIAVTVGGRRDYLKKRFDTAADADEWRQSEMAKLRAGKRAPRSTMTVREAIESWLASRRISESTRAAYTAALAPVVADLGDVRVQSLSADAVEGLIADLRAGKGPGGRTWKRTSINPMLARLKSVWKDLERRGVIERDLIRYIEPLRKKDDEDAPEGAMDVSDRLSNDEVEKLATLHGEKSLSAGVGLAALACGPRSVPYQVMARAPFVQLALLGLRRGELAGLRWDAIDLDAKTIAVAQRTRTTVSVTAKAGQSRGSTATYDQKHGKTSSASRVLPLPASVVPILAEARARQRRWRRDAGKAWVGEAGKDLHVFTTVTGKPISPRTLDDWWSNALKYAGVPHRRLHAARHTAASRLFAAGLSPAQVAAWLGHGDGGVLALRVYTHVEREELGAAAAVFEGSL